MTNADIAAALNLMGVLFRLDPVDPTLQPALAGFADGDFAVDWPCPGEVGPAFDAMAPLAADSAEGRAALHAAFRDLFVGPAALPAPPWGSVYLDQEKVLFGASTFALSTFLERNTITFRDPDNGPKDHFGTLCWIGAWLAAKDRMDVFDELMSEHVLPWAFLYLDEERVLFGTSTLLLSTFLDRNAIAFRDPDNGPKDHFGTLCWIGAGLASKDRMDAFDELMGEHLLPWAFLYLEELKTAALAMAQDNPAAAFYAAAAGLATTTLGAIKAERPVEIAKKKLYPGRTAAPR